MTNVQSNTANVSSTFGRQHRQHSVVHATVAIHALLIDLGTESQDRMDHRSTLAIKDCQKVNGPRRAGKEQDIT